MTHNLEDLRKKLAEEYVRETLGDLPVHDEDVWLKRGYLAGFDKGMELGLAEDLRASWAYGPTGLGECHVPKDKK